MLLFYILKIILKGDVWNMAVVYVTLIVEGKKEFKDVPSMLKEQVRQMLVDLDCGDLAVE
jgi:hypothetical protein